ncbi:glycosyltransferase [Hymenobacter sp. HMF4947]|uniref:Glycosyltransferase n=1 Tax=Hymenobacter ginkgonis TaxID=2682976 RepID=A0A7K1TEZ4_9BACT|nr:glycosyltransferase [Hymenobacter ginkgonis]MVN76983.1 glycosyltransferase [Hymenobacter ginkgonis]
MASLLSGRDIVVVGQQPWDTQLGSNCKDIALEFSRNNRVLYVNSPLDRNTLLRHRRTAAVQSRLRVIRGETDGIELISNNLWVVNPGEIVESINWLPASGLYSMLNKLNNRRFAKSIQKAIEKLNFTNVILFNDNDIFRSFHLKELLSPDVSIYYSRDFILAGGYWKKHGEQLEPQLIAKSDVCVANSSYLATYCKLYNPRGYDVGQGCDLTLAQEAQDAPCPTDLQRITGPLIGYVGALVSSRLDLEVLRYLSEQRPDWSIVLIGPEDEEFTNSQLHSLPNVHFLGMKAPGELPAYVRHFDVCLNPQRLNLLTIGNYPRKVDEYLALGKPVVATRTEAMSSFEEYVYLADNKEDYVHLIALALTQTGPNWQQQRRDFAATHTWENSVAKIYQAVLDFYAQRRADRQRTAQRRQSASPENEASLVVSI